MAVYEGVPTIPTYLGMKLNNAIQRRKSRERVSSVDSVSGQARWFKVLVRITMHIAGFSALTNAMFQWNIIAGWCAVAFSCFVFSWLFTGSSGQAPDDTGQMRR